MNVRLLPKKIINRIAAGEVVERPASVVKELIENAIDANSTEIAIVVEQGGRNLIKIIDNGCGIPKQEIRLSLERHATSKLPNDDLLNIEHLGFRGEALPSIASISRMIISSRIQSANSGWSIKIHGGEIIQDLTPSVSKYGTTVEIRDLFFATPNRLKFLKTERAETQYIVDIVTKVAMANSTIKFTLAVDDKKVLEYIKCENYLERLMMIKGKEFKDNIMQISATQHGLSLNACAGVPTYNRGNSNNLYLFVNNRPVRDILLIGAVKVAYQDFIPHGRYPIVVLFLTAPYQMVDVNVHPNKTEVRFQDKNLIRSFIVNELKLAIKKSLYHTTSEKSTKALSCFTTTHKSDNNLKYLLCEQQINNFNYDYNSSNKRSTSTLANAILANDTLTNDISSVMAPERLKQKNFEQLQIQKSLGMACCQLYSTYILSVTDESILLVDQHAAHERLVYEHLKCATRIERQSLLMPVVVHFNPSDVEIIITHNDELQKLGMVVERTSERTVIIREIPAILGVCDVTRLICDVLDTIVQFGVALSLQMRLDSISGTFACHTSIRAGRKLSISEMNAMLREMEKTPHSGQCNHGRPTCIKLNRSDIENLFERS